MSGLFSFGTGGGGSGVNIYNSDGTQTDTMRIYTFDSTTQALLFGKISDSLFFALGDTQSADPILGGRNNLQFIGSGVVEIISIPVTDYTFIFQVTNNTISSAIENWVQEALIQNTNANTQGGFVNYMSSDGTTHNTNLSIQEIDGDLIGIVGLNSSSVFSKTYLNVGVDASYSGFYADGTLSMLKYGGIADDGTDGNAWVVDTTGIKGWINGFNSVHFNTSNAIILGDAGGVGNLTTLTIDDNNIQIIGQANHESISLVDGSGVTIGTDGNFLVIEGTGGSVLLDVFPAGRIVEIGDTDATGNGTKITVDDAASTIRFDASNGLNINGTPALATFNGAVTNLTVVDGIVTAAS